MNTVGVLTERRVLVAGGAGHVGRILVSALLDAGAKVAVPSRSATRLAALRAAVTGGSADALVTIEGDVADEGDGPRVLDEALRQLGGIDAVVASMGGFVMAPSVLDATADDLRRTLENYVVAHFRIARNVLPVLQAQGGSYTFINGFLAFGPVFRGAGLVAAATASQAMLTRVIMQEMEGSSVRMNEVVLYSSFGRDDDEERNRGIVSKEDVGRFVALLMSDRGGHVRGQTIHLKSMEAGALMH